ncbi:MAG: hypothetical protein WD894_25760 [Pirellulales bacterium]
MTLAAGYKFEHPKAAGVSPILLLSDSRYSRGGEPNRDDGKKVWQLATNVFAVIAGDVLTAQRALATVKERLDASFRGSFEDVSVILRSSFESHMMAGNPQQPHCILASMALDGSSKLFYARPLAGRYEVTERTSVVIGLVNLEPVLREKIEEPAARAGPWHPRHFMMHPDDVLRNDIDRRQQAIRDAWDISFHVVSQFLLVVENPTVAGANPPLQNVFLTPGRAQHMQLFQVGGIDQIARRTAQTKEVSGVVDPLNGPIEELTVW